MDSESRFSRRIFLVIGLLVLLVFPAFSLAEFTYTETSTKQSKSDSGNFYLVFNVDAQVEWHIVPDLTEKDSNDESRYLVSLDAKSKIAHITFSYPNTGLSRFDLSWTILALDDNSDTIRYYLTAENVDTTYGTVTPTTSQDDNTLAIQYNKVGSSSSTITIADLYFNLSEDVEEKSIGDYHSTITVVYSGV